MSGNALTILGAPDEPALAIVRYTHRQRRAVENVRFVLEQELEGRCVPLTDADQEYAASVAAPIREAQALVAGNQSAVLWRLLAYLARYRAQVIVGFLAATLITVVSLVPPYLAGYLIDSVVRPVQDGTISVEDGAAVAWLAVAAMATHGGEVTDSASALVTYTELFEFLMYVGLGVGVFVLLVSPLLRRGMHGVH